MGGCQTGIIEPSKIKKFMKNSKKIQRKKNSRLLRKQSCKLDCIPQFCNDYVMYINKYLHLRL